MIKVLDTIGGFIDLAVTIIIFPLIILVHTYIGVLITFKYIRLYSSRATKYLLLKKWPAFHLTWRINFRFNTRLLPLRKLTR